MHYWPAWLLGPPAYLCNEPPAPRGAGLWTGLAEGHECRGGRGSDATTIHASCRADDPGLRPCMAPGTPFFQLNLAHQIGRLTFRFNGSSVST